MGQEGVGPSYFDDDDAFHTISAKGLCETKALACGFCQSMISEDRELLTFHANAILFNIVNACTTRRQALREAMQLLNKHSVSI